MVDVRRSIALVLTMLTAAGCTSPIQRGKSLLLPAQMSSDSVVLDIFFVRFPFGDSSANEKLWEEIDEQSLPVDLRQQLAQNGFRVGVASAQMPAELAKLLELSGKPAPNGKLEQTQVTEMDVQPRVMMRHLQLRAGKRSEIMASGVYDELPVLVRDRDGSVTGNTYQEAQGIFALKARPMPNDQIQIELTPELHHGQRRQQWIAQHGVVRMDYDRPKCVFDAMTTVANLAPGASLVLSSLPNRPGSLGHHFFSEKADRLEQKLLVIRLSQTQNNDLFGSGEPEKTAE
jgi:hypothetical protein